ncbi:DHH family phosphoesterase [Patescibacteria group bacterium]|nr:DHH family phosphoesterase [Patescibacteria group bacterium]
MKSKYRQLKKIIDNAQNILIPFHLSPDGDMVGSGLALAAYCQSLGKKVRVVTATPVDSDWGFLPYFDLIEDKDPADLDLSQFDLIIFADCDGPYRVSKQDNFTIPDIVSTATIDHHPTNKEQCSLNIVDTQTVSSAVQLILYFFEEFNINITKDIATLLYWGLIMDTGVFEYGKNLSAAHTDAVRLLKLDVPHDELIFRMKCQSSPQFIKYIARGLSNLQVDNEAGFCWMALSYKELKEMGLENEKFKYGLTPYLKTVKGTEFGTVFVEEKPDYIRGSLRSRRQDGFDVSALAKALGGGGHRAAAAFTLEMPFKEAEELVLAKAREYGKAFISSRGTRTCTLD